mgnify:CR=1 FL=1
MKTPERARFTCPLCGRWIYADEAVETESGFRCCKDCVEKVDESFYRAQQQTEADVNAELYRQSKHINF